MTDKKTTAGDGLSVGDGLTVGTVDENGEFVADPPADVELAGLSLVDDGQTVALTMGAGNAIPSTITVHNAAGEPVATYTAGPPPPTARIVGGAPATPHEFPWMIDLR